MQAVERVRKLDRRIPYWTPTAPRDDAGDLRDGLEEQAVKLGSVSGQPAEDRFVGGDDEHLLGSTECGARFLGLRQCRANAGGSVLGNRLQVFKIGVNHGDAKRVLRIVVTAAGGRDDFGALVFQDQGACFETVTHGLRFGEAAPDLLPVGARLRYRYGSGLYLTTL